MRINPREVHIHDPDFFDQLYSTSLKLNKDGYYYRFTASESAGFGTASYTLHRQRRKAYNRFFSPSAILDLQPLVSKCTLKLCSRCEEYVKTGKPVILASALRSLATDVISQYVLPQGFDLLSSRDFGEDFNNVNRRLSGVAAYNRHFPFILPMMMKMPISLLKLTASPGMLQMLEFQGHNQKMAKQIASSGKQSDESVLHGIYNSDLPESDKTAARIYQEALTLVGAGSETTGSALEHVFWHVLSNPPIKARLRAEVAEGAQTGDLLTQQTLSNLPYLNACIKEGLRMGNEVSGRLARYDPHNPIVYKSYTFPPGTVISMSMRDMHLDPYCFPEPNTFNPDRWLDEKTRKRCEQYFWPFGKGTRSCVGRDLAMLEMTMVTANLFNRFDMELHETRWEDVRMEHDFFSPFRRDESKGVQVIMK